MKNKIFLSSMLIMSVAPAMAEPSNTDTFPSDGYMQENYTYTGAATSDHMDGVYEGSVNATAEYEDVLYQIAAGQYLPAGAESPIDCNQSGYFCAGVQNGVYYDANNNQGLTSCSTATNGAYTLSDGTGTSADSCYATNTVSCSTRNPYIGGHATNVVYGNSTNGNASCKTYYADTNTCVLDEINACKITDLTCENGYHKEGDSKTNPLERVDISAQLIKNYTRSLDDYCEYADGNPPESCNDDPVLKNMKSNEWKNQYSYGTVSGIASCNNTTIDNIQEHMVLLNKVSLGEASEVETNQFFQSVLSSMQPNGTFNTTSTGANCWCQIRSLDNAEAISKWFYLFNTEYTGGNCASQCSVFCATAEEKYRAILYQDINADVLACSANTITINWTGADAEDISANNAGTATYGSDVRTPVKAQTIKGKTFKGWRFSKPTQTTTGN